MNVSTGSIKHEKRTFESYKIENVISKYREIKDKWYISNIRFFVGILTRNNLNKIDELL